MHSDQAEAALLTWLVELEQSIPFETWVSSTGALEPEVRSLYRSYVETGSRLRGGVVPRPGGAGAGAGAGAGDDEDDDATPRRIGRYTLLRLLGQGGFGSVHLAREDDGGCLVVLKALDPALRERADVLARFGREVRAVSVLRHEAVPGALAIDLHSETPHYVTRFVPGAPLDLVLAELRGIRPRRRTGADLHRAIEAVSQRLLGPHAPSTAPPGPESEGSYAACMLRLFLPLADALRVVHEHGLIHRDVKPSNILLGVSGGSYLLDFGLARDVASASITRTGALVGTPYYASPEQLSGRRALLQERTDTYSLGVSLYEALAGRRPFEGEGAELYRRILTGEPDDPRDHNEALPPDLSTVLLKALAKDPAKRYGAAELRGELAAVLELRPIATRPPGLLARWARLARRHPTFALVAGVLSVALLVALTTSIVHRLQRSREVTALVATGQDRLAAGDARAARDFSERALGLRPDDAAARNLGAAADAALLLEAERVRRAESAQLAAQEQRLAEAALARLDEERARAADLDQQVLGALRQSRPWYPPFRKEPLLALQAQQAQVGAARDEAFREAHAHVLSALQLEPERVEARALIARAAFDEYCDAEARRDRSRMERFQTFIEAYDDGALAAERAGVGSVTITSEPPGATAYLFRYEERERRLLPVGVPGGPQGCYPSPDHVGGPWHVLRLTAFDHGDSAVADADATFGTTLQAGDEITLLCGDPRWSAERARAHLAGPEEHFVEGLRDGELIMVRLLGGWHGVLEGEVEQREGYPLARDDAHRLGVTPLPARPLAMGSYLLLLEKPGYAPTRCPFEITRGEEQACHAVLLPEGLPRAAAELVGPKAELVHVTGGGAIFGGDDGAHDSWNLVDAPVGDFLIQRREVSFGEYLAFLRDLEASDPAAAQARAPRIAAEHRPLWSLDEQGRLVLHPPEDELDDALVGVSCDDAEAYCAWLTERAQSLAKPGRPALVFGLPLEKEWEKAGRGADGRAFTWGNAYEPTFAHVGFASYEPTIAPGGLYPTDESPYGVRDLCGNVREWCAEPSGNPIHVIRGGCFSDNVEGAIHLANRSHRRERTWTDTETGFRVVVHLAPPAAPEKP